LCRCCAPTLKLLKRVDLGPDRHKAAVPAALRHQGRQRSAQYILDCFSIRAHLTQQRVTVCDFFGAFQPSVPFLKRNVGTPTLISVPRHPQTIHDTIKGSEAAICLCLCFASRSLLLISPGTAITTIDQDEGGQIKPRGAASLIVVLLRWPEFSLTQS